MAVDSAGNVFIADASNNLVVQVSAAGTLDVIAGNGIGGFSGDGGAATSASLNSPGLPFFGGVAVDSVGNLYIVDANNNRVRKISNGVITTVAGNGKCRLRAPNATPELSKPIAVSCHPRTGFLHFDISKAPRPKQHRNTAAESGSRGASDTVLRNIGSGSGGDRFDYLVRLR